MSGGGGGGMSFEATDNAQNVFNPGDLLSRADGGGINFGVSGSQLVMVVGIAALAVVGFFFLTKRGGR